MKETEIHVFSDASFSKRHSVAVTGFLFIDDVSRMVAEGEPLVQTRVFKEKNNIRAEIEGIIYAIEQLIDVREQTKDGAPKKESAINLYTDCQSIVRLLVRREKLESSDYISRRSGKQLSNADLYKRFFNVYDRVSLKLCLVKGHSPKKGRDIVGDNFARVDKETRKVLRGHCLENHNSTNHRPTKNAEPFV